ncbi:MAG: MFS transporter [Actinomycetes bacterium]
MTPTPELPAPADPFHRIRTNYLVGLSVWSFGFGIISLASFLIVYDKTKSVSATGLVIVCLSVPQLLLPAVATKLCRSWGAPTLYVVGNALCCIIGLLPVALSLLGLLSVPALLAWYVLLGIVFGICTPSSGILRVMLAAPGKLPEFDGAATMAWAAASVIGYLVGAGAYAALGATWVYLIGAMAYLPLTLAVVPLIKRAPAVAVNASEHFRDVLSVWHNDGGIRATTIFTLLCFTVGGYTVVLPALASTLGTNPGILAILEAASVFGGLFASVIIKRVQGRFGWDSAVRFASIMIAISLGVLAVMAFHDGPSSFISASNAWISMFVITGVIIGASLGLDFQSSILNAVVQNAAPTKERDAVLTGYALVPLLAVPIGQEAIGLIADNVSLAAGIGVTALCLLAFVLISPHTDLHKEFDVLHDAVITPGHGASQAATTGRHVQ